MIARTGLFAIAGPAARRGAMLALRDAEGRTGLGEAAPLVGFCAETLAGAVRALGVSETLQALPEGLPAIEAIERVLGPHESALRAAPTARFALETALLDLLARRRGLSIAACLREGTNERGLAPRAGEGAATEGALAPVEVSALVTQAAEPKALVAAGVAAAERGFRAIKVKLRASDEASLAREIEALVALRSALPDVALRLDPNGRWSIADARRFLDRLACVAPQFVEQPVAPLDLARLGPCAVPWAADESLAIESAVDRMAPETGCSAFVIKPAVHGIRRAIELARVARSRGLGVVVTHFMDGPIGLAAACETALALDPAPLACGLDPHAGVADLPRALLPHHARPATVTPSGAAPGLGFDAGAIDALLANARIEAAR